MIQIHHFVVGSYRPTAGRLRNVSLDRRFTSQIRYSVVGVNDMTINVQPRFITCQQIGRRSFFKSRNFVDTNTASTSSSNSNGKNDVKPNNYSMQEKSISDTQATSTEKVEMTNRNKIWEYTKNMSSRSFTAVKESTRSSMNWLGAKVSSSVQRNVNQIQQQAQRSIETTRIRATQEIEGVRDRVTSNIREGTQSLLSTFGAPFQSVWNTMKDTWRTTPIWNRFFYWSLSAIAVYGIVTTLPKEILKLAIIPQSATTTTTSPPPASRTTTSSPPNRDIAPPEDF